VSEQEKTLRIEVAEALGWRDTTRTEHAFGWSEEWCGIPPGRCCEDLKGDKPEIPPYGEESPEGWACTGPLLARFQVSLVMASWLPQGGWYCGPVYQGDSPPLAKGLAEKPCEAIARFVVALGKAGKLPR
jgi:hypothetical protein